MPLAGSATMSAMAISPALVPSMPAMRSSTLAILTGPLAGAGLSPGSTANTGAAGRNPEMPSGSASANCRETVSCPRPARRRSRMLADRVQYFTESVIREMTRLAQQHNAVNLGQGMPDFETPQELKDAACRAIQEGFNQYAITWGAPPLRKAIAEKVRRFNGIPCDPDENVTVCCGATECMMATMLSLVNPGD